MSKEFEYYCHPNLELHQIKMMELLKFFIETCDKYELDYWLDGGSLLGLARHASLIPWDDDIDICIPISSYYKLLDILDEIGKKNSMYSLYYRSNGLVSWGEYLCLSNWYCEYKSGYIKPIRIDLIPVKEVAFVEHDIDKKLVEDVYEYVVAKIKPFKMEDKIKALDNYNEYMKGCIINEDDCLLIKGHGQYSPIKEIEKKYVYPLIKKEFMGMNVKIPHNMDYYLKKSYGIKYMTLPKVKSRRPMSINAYYSDKLNDKVNKLIKFDYESNNLGFIRRNFKKYLFLLSVFGFRHVITSQFKRVFKI
ncbi:LicD family protein [Photobacterium damselae]